MLTLSACQRPQAMHSVLPAPGQDDPPGSAPELPRVTMELPPDSATQLVRVLNVGDDLQGAINSAKPGDVIALAPGAVFTGSFTLPPKSGDQWITIRTAAPDNTFALRGTRVDPSKARLMPVIQSASGSILTADAGAHHYRFVGIQIRPNPGAFLYNAIALGEDETNVEDLPHHIVFERCYIHGDPQAGGRRGIALNSRYTAIVDSYLSDFKEEGADSQAIAGWNGLGPFKISNNYLEAAGENVMFGGADPTITNLVPADIEITRNLFSKPMTWKIGEPSYAGKPWAVKNLFELKNAHRILIEGNLFEYNWPHAQNGFAILFTPRDQSGSAPWSMVQDVTFTHNIVRHVASGVNILGTDDGYPSDRAKRILIKDNLFEDVGGPRWGGAGRLFQILSGAVDVVIDHNTGFQTDAVVMADGTPPAPGFVYKNNITPHGTYGIIGSGVGVGNVTLKQYFPGALVLRNVLVGGDASLYPAGNFFPPSLADVGFVDLPGGNYRLKPDSAYKNGGTDGKDLGADIDAIQTALTRGLPRQRPSRSR